MKNQIELELKDSGEKIRVSDQEVEEIVPDADFRYCLLVLKDGSKHFVCGTRQEIEASLGRPVTAL